MREIKFRAWNRVQQVISEPFALNNITANKDFVVGIPGWDCCDSFSAVIFLEYTGLKDKNGVEIYEGDIVEYKEESEYGLAEVKTIHNTCNLAFYWDLSTIVTDVPHLYSHIDYFGYQGALEVIGNIFENPELLEGEL